MSVGASRTTIQRRCSTAGSAARAQGCNSKLAPRVAASHFGVCVSSGSLRRPALRRPKIAVWSLAIDRCASGHFSRHQKRVSLLFCEGRRTANCIGGGGGAAPQHFHRNGRHGLSLFERCFVLEVQVNFGEHGGTHVCGEESLDAELVVFKLVSGFIPLIGMFSSNSFGWA